VAAVRYTRAPKLGDSGIDIDAIGRALIDAGCAGKLSLRTYMLLPRWWRRKWGRRKQGWLRKFKRRHGLHPADAVYGQRAHRLLTPHFDDFGRDQMRRWKPTPKPQQEQWHALLEAMRAVSAQTPGYLYGGEHDGSFADDDPGDRFDCSSSCSYVLKKAGMFPFDHAIVSGEFARSWGEPGKGDLFTVYAHDGHVWIRLHRGRWWRFDTSAYGDSRSPRSGARLRFLPRSWFGFTARHWPGM
jgi:hypothetical protein